MYGKKDTESQSKHNFRYVADSYTDKVAWTVILYPFSLYTSMVCLCPVTLQKGECTGIAFIPFLFLKNEGFKRHW